MGSMRTGFAVYLSFLQCLPRHYDVRLIQNEVVSLCSILPALHKIEAVGEKRSIIIGLEKAKLVEHGQLGHFKQSSKVCLVHIYAGHVLQ